MGGGLFVRDDASDESTDSVRGSNFDYSDYQYDYNGIKLSSNEEATRANSAIAQYASRNKLKKGDIRDTPAVTIGKVTAYSYTFRMTGDSPFEYVIIGRLRIR